MPEEIKAYKCKDGSITTCYQTACIRDAVDEFTEAMRGYINRDQITPILRYPRIIENALADYNAKIEAANRNPRPAQ